MRAVALAALLLAFSQASAFAQANRTVGAMTSGKAAKCYICGTPATASGQVNGVNLSWCADHERNPLRQYQGRQFGVTSVPSRPRTPAVSTTPAPVRPLAPVLVPARATTPGTQPTQAARTGALTTTQGTSAITTKPVATATTPVATTAKRPVRIHRAGSAPRVVTPAKKASAPAEKSVERSSTGAR